MMSSPAFNVVNSEISPSILPPLTEVDKPKKRNWGMRFVDIHELK